MVIVTAFNDFFPGRVKNGSRVAGVRISTSSYEFTCLLIPYFWHRLFTLPFLLPGRIAAFLFLKNLQPTSILLLRIFLGLLFHYDRKHMYGVVGKVAKDYGLFPDAESQEKLAKQLFGINSLS